MAIPTDVDITWLDSGTVSLNAAELRRADSGIYAGIGSALGIGGGVVRHGDTTLVPTVDGSDVVTIQPGPFAIPGNAVSGTGCYRGALAAAITGSLAARNATNPRITLVVVRAMDDDVVTSHDAYTGRFAFVDGTPGAVPAVPTLPTMAIELGRITVPQTGGGAATVDLTHRTYATAVGARQIVPASAMLPASAAKWQEARALDTGAKYVFDGTTWVLDGPFAEYHGTALCTGTSVIVGGFGSVAVAFPAGRFTVAPIVIPHINGFVTNSSAVVAKYASSVTTSGCTLNFVNLGAGTTSWTSLPVGYHAYQMTPTTAVG